MCVSQLRRVLAHDRAGTVTLADAAGVESRASLLAYDGVAPRPGSWVLVHSGYVLAAVEDEEAAAILAALETLDSARPRSPSGADRGSPAPPAATEPSTTKGARP